MNNFVHFATPNLNIKFLRIIKSIKIILSHNICQAHCMLYLCRPPRVIRTILAAFFSASYWFSYRLHVRIISPFFLFRLLLWIWSVCLAPLTQFWLLDSEILCWTSAFVSGSVWTFFCWCQFCDDPWVTFLSFYAIFDPLSDGLFSFLLFMC